MAGILSATSDWVAIGASSLTAGAGALIAFGAHRHRVRQDREARRLVEDERRARVIDCGARLVGLLDTLQPDVIKSWRMPDPNPVLELSEVWSTLRHDLIKVAADQPTLRRDVLSVVAKVDRVIAHASQLADSVALGSPVNDGQLRNELGRLGVTVRRLEL